MSKADMVEVIEGAPQNLNIQNTLFRMNLLLDRYRNPACSISGGSDSDTMVDIIERVRGSRPVTYIFFDTGIEYAATHQHLEELEEKYGIRIERRRAVVPVPLGCGRYGVPFISKQISEWISRLQRHGFRWEDEPFEVLCEKYPGCKSALKWWCNRWELENGKESFHNIKNIQYLREFMLDHPPAFPISDRCCKGAKKDTAHLADTELGAGLKILGLRRAEGGVRATAYTSCFTPEGDTIAHYRPLWFWSDADKAEYKAHYGLRYSDCYEVWGFKRTGCAGCPFNSRFEDDLAVMRAYEPRLYQAAQGIFGASYEYTRAYRAYRDKRKAAAQGQTKGQLAWDDCMEAK